MAEPANSKEISEETPLSPEIQELRDLYGLMVEENLELVELQSKDLKLRLSRVRPGLPSEAPVPTVALPRHSAARGEPAPVAQQSNLTAISAPLAGVFYRASSPASAPFAKEGDVVDVGQTLCLIEAMKVMNEIKAQKPCRIMRIPAENSRPVTAGQTLFLVEPA